MSELWRLNAEIRSGVLLVNQDYTLNFHGEPGDDTVITFDFPQKVEADIWSNWDHGIPQNLWDYKITYKFRARDENEARQKAWMKLENLAALLSFVASTPVTIKSYGSITNSPENPIVGQQYTTISRTFEQGWVGRRQPVIETSDIDFLTKIIIPDNLVQEGQERVLRSMRWLQNSHFASSPLEEFMSLMIAFEAVSHLIKPSEPNYWYCSHCDTDITACPICGHSTEWAGSGKSGMEHFVTEMLGWNKSDWNPIWISRNLVFHGNHDLTSQQQQEITIHLPKLEQAVVSVLRYLLRIPGKAPPRTLRERGHSYGAELYLRWTKGTTLNTDKVRS